MSVATSEQNVVDFPSRSPKLRHQHAQTSPETDADMIQLCAALCEARKNVRHFAVTAPQQWQESSVDRARVCALIQDIADIPTFSRIGLRAKALALRALLDDDGDRLYKDAAAPDVLAWSLVRDILTED